MSDDNTTSLQDIQAELTRSGALTLDEKTVGADNLALLRRLFPHQSAFQLTQAAVGDAAEAYLNIDAAFSGLLPWVGQAPARFMFFDHDSGRQLLFRLDALAGAYLLLSQYSLHPGDPLPGSDEEAPYIALAELISEIAFHGQPAEPAVLFSSFDYAAAGDGVPYPQALSQAFPVAQVRPGLNFPAALTLAGDMAGYLAALFGGEHGDPAAARARIFTRDDLPHVTLTFPATAARQIGSFTLSLTAIDLTLPLYEGADPWPDVALAGKISGDGHELDVSADLDLYYHTLSLAFHQLPSLGSLIDLADYFPGALSALLDVELTALSMHVDLDAGSISQISLSAASEQPITLFSLSPTAGVAFKPSLDLQITAPFAAEQRLLAGRLQGQWQLGQTNFDTTLTFPHYHLTAGMALEETLDATAVLAHLFPGLDLPSLALTKLDLEADYLNQTAAAAICVDGKDSWKFSLAGSEFALEEISLITSYGAGGLEQCRLDARLELAAAEFLISGSYEADAGLSLSGQTAPGATLDVAALENHLMQGLSLPAAFPRLELTDIFFAAAPQAGAYSLSGRTAAGWPLADGLTLQIVQFAIRKTAGQPVSGLLEVTLTLAGVPVHLQAEKAAAADGGWQFAGSTDTGQPIPVGDLVDDLAQQFGAAELPAAIEGLTLENLHVTYDSQSKDFTISGAGKLPVEGTEADFVLAVAIDHQAGAYTTHFSGQLTVAGYEFDVLFERAAGSEELIATFKPQTPIDLKALVAGLVASPDLHDLAPPVTVSVQDLLFAHQKKEPPALTLLALDLDASFTLLDLPLLGNLVGGGTVARVGNLKLVYTTRQLAAADVGRLNALLPAGIVPLPKGSGAGPAFNKGFNVTAELHLGDASLELSTTAVSREQTAAVQLPPPPAGAMSSSPPPTGGAKWFTIQKDLGPLHVHKIGLLYQDGALWFLVAADLSLGGLTLSLDGLGVSSALDHFDPHFHLQGLGIDFKKETLEIGGAFLHLEGQNPDGSHFDEYNGLLRVSAGDLALSAIGSYANLQGHSSLFAYLTLDYPLGGPSFFFVTGLAAGFGYNRSLLMPPAEQVASFPLVAQAMSGSAPPPAGDPQAIRSALSSQMEVLHHYLPPTLGEYFLAVGISFTSFELLHGFVLVSASFGARFVLNVLGLLSFATPPERVAGEPALIQAELAITATFDPAAGFLGMRAVLTDNSYLLDPACHLTGGMAFSSWFSGDHAGEFVLTVGGYHPHFRAPDYYPRVPRLDVTWQVTDELSIHGNAYFALTGHAFMAGGALAAVWHSGRLRAWFKADADFLIQWKPYHYEISMHVEIGASLTIHFFGTHTLSGTMGADLEIWGPPFAGRASARFVFVSVSVEFGPEKRPPDPLNWSAFRQAFLPAGDEALFAIGARGGLVQQLSDVSLDEHGNVVPGSNGSGHWLVNGSEFAVAVDAVIPANHWQQGSGGAVQQEASKLGIAPMDVRAADVTSTLEITLEHAAGGQAHDVTARHFRIEPIQKPVPVGLWGNVYHPDVNHAPMVDGVLAGFIVRTTPPVAPDETHAVNRRNLGFEAETISGPPVWEDAWSALPFAEPLPGKDAAAVAQALFGHFLPGTNSDDYSGPLSAAELLAQPQ